MSRLGPLLEMGEVVCVFAGKSRTDTFGTYLGVKKGDRVRIFRSADGSAEDGGRAPW